MDPVEVNGRLEVEVEVEVEVALEVRVEMEDSEIQKMEARMDLRESRVL